MPSQIKLTTSDNEEFNVDKDVAERSVLIKNMLEGVYIPFSMYRTRLAASLTDVSSFHPLRCRRERAPYSSP